VSVMLSWWHRDVIAAGKLPLMLCFVSFVVTFVSTRTITRLIRDGRGPFRNVTAGGTHVHHSVPGIILLMIGAFRTSSAVGRRSRTRRPARNRRPSAPRTAVLRRMSPPAAGPRRGADGGGQRRLRLPAGPRERHDGPDPGGAGVTEARSDVCARVPAPLHMPAMSLATRSSAERNGSLHSTVR
jgi:hypothetical protein